MAAQFLVAALPRLVADAVYGLRGALAPATSDNALALALLPVGAAVAWAGVDLGARWRARDPWRVHTLLKL